MTAVILVVMAYIILGMTTAVAVRRFILSVDGITPDLEIDAQVLSVISFFIWWLVLAFALITTGACVLAQTIKRIEESL